MVGYRPRDWHVLDLDKDPTPGDPDRVRTLAKSLHDFADDVSDALKVVKGDVQNAKSAHTKAQSNVTGAQNALDAATKMAEDARTMREDAGTGGQAEDR